jgi:hypothetical protein
MYVYVRTSKNGEDSLMNSLYLSCLQYVAREQRYYEENYEDGKRP